VGRDGFRPKSISLTALAGGDERMREVHRDSVRIALQQLEDYTQTRIGGNHSPEATGKFEARRIILSQEDSHI